MYHFRQVAAGLILGLALGWVPLRARAQNTPSRPLDASQFASSPNNPQTNSKPGEFDASAKHSSENLPPLANPPLASPPIFLEKIGPPIIALGKPLVYDIIVRNISGVALHDVHIRDEIPATVHFLNAQPPASIKDNVQVWDLGVLQPNQEQRIKVAVQPTAEGDVFSQATATFTTSSAIQTRVIRPQLVVTQQGPADASMGEPVDIIIQVSNTGSGPATGVMLHDHLPPGLWHEQGKNLEAELGTVAPGETKKVTLNTTAVQAGSQINDVVISADDTAKAAAQATVTITEANLTFKTSAPARRFLNKEATFTLEVANIGNATANNVRVVDTLPPGLELIAAKDGVHDAASRTIQWKLGDLAPGQKRTVIIQALPINLGSLLNHAIAQADRGFEAKSDTILQVDGIPALLLEVGDSNDPVEVGGETTYKIRVVNQGTGFSTNVQITAAVPAGMSTRDAAGPTPHRLQGQQIVFEPMAKLAPQAELIYQVKVVGQKPGDMRFKVLLTEDHLNQPVYKEESTCVYKD